MKTRALIFFKKEMIFSLVAIFIISLPVIYKLIRPGFFSMYDDMQVIRLQQMDMCLKDGQFPCRWVPDLGLGYGYPLYQYYAPLPYYFMETIHLLGFSYIDSVKIGFAASIFFAALFFYLFAKNFFSKTISLAVAFLYIYSPFRAQDLYVRGAMGELWGAAMVPLVFYSFERVLKKNDRRSFTLFCIALGLFLISHNLTVLIFSPFIVVWIAVRLFMSKKFRQLKKNLTVSAILGTCLSAFFIVPLIVERNLVHIETLTSGYFGYLQHFLNLKQIFLSIKWGYGPTILGPNDEAFLGIGPIHSLLAFLGVAFTIARFGIKNKRVYLPVTLLLTFLAGAFLTHERSTFVWKLIPTMEIIQFPWRFVMICVFVSSLLLGYFINTFSQKLHKVAAAIVILLTIGVYGSFFQPKDWFNITDTEKLSGDSYKMQLMASIYDFLPKSAKRAPDNIASDDLIVIEGEVETVSLKSGSNWFEYDVNVISDEAELAIPTYDFPGWRVHLDSMNVDTGRYGDFGLVSFSAPEGSVFISSRLFRSWPRAVGDTLTIISFLFLVWLYFSKATIWENSTKR